MLVTDWIIPPFPTFSTRFGGFTGERKGTMTCWAPSQGILCENLAPTNVSRFWFPNTKYLISSLDFLILISRTFGELKVGTMASSIGRLPFAPELHPPALEEAGSVSSAGHASLLCTTGILLCSPKLGWCRTSRRHVDTTWGMPRKSTLITCPLVHPWPVLEGRPRWQP